jgi:hypothetical protein
VRRPDQITDIHRFADPFHSDTKITAHIARFYS